MRHYTIAFAVVLACAALLAAWWVSGNDLAEDHLAAMDNAWREMETARDEDRHDDQEAAIRRYEQYRERLTDDGYFVYRQFTVLARGQIDDLEWDEVQNAQAAAWEAVRTAFPHHRDVNLELSSGGLILHVWCRPDDVDKWERFVEDMNADE